MDNGFIDVLFPEERLLIEQKNAGIDSDKPEDRQDTQVTPVQQALRYADSLPFSLKPAVLCTCNFGRFVFMILTMTRALQVSRLMSSRCRNWATILKYSVY